MSAGFPAFFMGEQREKDNKGETEMEKFFIEGPSRLEGEVVISGAKNAAVAIIPAVLFLMSGILLQHPALIASALIFGVFHVAIVKENGGK